MQLDDYIKKHNISRRDMANKLGISQGYLSMICSGKRAPSRYLAILMQDATDGAIKARKVRPDIKTIR